MRKPLATIVTLALLGILPNVPVDVFPHAATSNTVLFDREIVRLLDEHCVMCHAEGGAAFPLETYEQVWLARREIHDAILARQMPPWSAVPGYGDFVNANDLTLRETRFIVSWVEGLGPRNDGEVFLNVLGSANEAPAEVRAAADFESWRIGGPDLFVAVPPPSTDAATNDGRNDRLDDGSLQVVRSVIETGFAVASPIRALEYHPGDLRSLRAVEFSIEATGQWLATWTPWHGLRELPDEVAIVLPAGARIVAEFHLVDGAAAIDDAGVLGLSFANPGPANEIGDIVLEAEGPGTAGGGRQRLEARRVLDGDTTVLGLWPRFPGGARSLEVRARAPDGGITILLAALDLPAGWPTPYLLAEPQRLPAGSEVRFIMYRDAGEPIPGEASATLVLSAY